MMLSTFAKNRLFIKSFLSILMLLMLFLHAGRAEGKRLV